MIKSKKKLFFAQEAVWLQIIREFWMHVNEFSELTDSKVVIMIVVQQKMHWSKSYFPENWPLVTSMEKLLNVFLGFIITKIIAWCIDYEYLTVNLEFFFILGTQFCLFFM